MTLILSPSSNFELALSYKFIAYILYKEDKHTMRQWQKPALVNGICYACYIQYHTV